MSGKRAAHLAFNVAQSVHKKARAELPSSKAEQCLASDVQPHLIADLASGRQLGRIRWYSGRKQTGVVEADDGQEFIVPVGGAANLNLCPPTAGGLIHGTRVSFERLLQQDANPVHCNTCTDVRPFPDCSQPGLEVGVETRTGGRPSNEDRIAAADVADLGFLAGVFDGHGGECCVDFVTQRLPASVHAHYGARATQQQGGVASLSTVQETELIARVLRDAFATTDEEFMAMARQARRKDGSTAVVALLAHGFEEPPPGGSVRGCPGGVAKLFVAWCGDSRAVLLRGRGVRRLSEDHKPERRDETKRIQKAGGAVVIDAEGVYRVGRQRPSHEYYLSTSRSFGDLPLKEPQPLVIADPEIMVCSLTPEDWAVVLACDGVWNTMSDDDVCDACWEAMAQQALGPVDAAREVADRAQARGSTDNITVLVMRLGWAELPRTLA